MSRRQDNMFKKTLTISILSALLLSLTACAEQEEPLPPPPYSHTTLNPEEAIGEWFKALREGDAEKASNIILPSISNINSIYSTDFQKNMHIMPQQDINMNAHYLLSNQMLANAVAPDKHTIITGIVPDAQTQKYDIQVEYTIEGRTLETTFTAYRATKHYWLLQGGYELIQLEFNEYAPEYLVNENTVKAEMLNRTLTPNFFAAFVFEPIRYNVKLPETNPNFILPETTIQQTTLGSLMLKPERLEKIQGTITQNINECLKKSREERNINCPNWYYQSTPYIKLLDSSWTASAPTFNSSNIFTQNTAYITMSLTLNLTYEQYVDQRRKTDTEIITRQETVQRSAVTTKHYLNSRGELEVDILWDRTPSTMFSPITVDGETITYFANNWM